MYIHVMNIHFMSQKREETKRSSKAFIAHIWSISNLIRFKMVYTSS